MFELWFKINQKIRFLMVGGFNTLFSFMLYTLGVMYFECGYGIILSVVYFISVNLSIFSMRSLVFRGQGALLYEYIKAWAVYLLMLLFNYVCLWAMVEQIGLGEIISQLIYTILSTIFIFYLHRELTFSHKK